MPCLDVYSSAFLHSFLVSFQLFFEALFHRLTDKLQSRTYLACLESIRLLSREKSGLESAATESTLRTLLTHAGLVLSSEDESDVGFATIQDAFGNNDCTKML